MKSYVIQQKNGRLCSWDGGPLDTVVWHSLPECRSTFDPAVDERILCLTSWDCLDSRICTVSDLYRHALGAFISSDHPGDTPSFQGDLSAWYTPFSRMLRRHQDGAESEQSDN